MVSEIEHRRSSTVLFKFKLDPMRHRRIPFAEVRKVLIYRPGSLGDTVVALPCIHLITRVFTQAERLVLTNFPVDSKAPSVSSILEGSGLVHGYLEYPLGIRDPRFLRGLRATIRQWQPDVLIHLAERKGWLTTLQDVLFFKSCGIATLIGVPYTKRLRTHQWLEQFECYEYEASRLARCLSVLGDAQLQAPESWDLHLTLQEEERAQLLLDNWPGGGQFIACSLGTKTEVSHWGVENWRSLMRELYLRFPDCGLILVGREEEHEQSEAARQEWRGTVLNLCGKLTPRESAAVLKRARLFIGHDSGPMHLAAAMGVPCVAIFSARQRPGVWFPYGQHHKIIYHQTECHGCGLDVCHHYQKKCITSIRVAEVMVAVGQVFGGGSPVPLGSLYSGRRFASC
jgi:heptosyltransferase-3